MTPSISFEDVSSATTNCSCNNDAINHERKVNKVLAKLFSNERLSDITLEGSDGKKIGANRCILAARSEVFEKMLYGEFTEAKANVIKVNYGGEVINSFVEYCYFDEARLLSKDDHSFDDAWARRMTELYSAADYYSIDSLKQKTIEVGTKRMYSSDASLACSFFDAARGTELGEAAMIIIRQRPFEALQSIGLLSLSSVALAEIIKDSQLIDMEEIIKFRALQDWSEAPVSMVPKECLIESESSLSSRQKVASGIITKHIDLRYIKPTDLRDVVEPSGLVSENAIAEAFKAQALFFEMFANKLPSGRSPVWENSNDAIVWFDCKEETQTSLLRCFPLEKGSVHVWSIRIACLLNSDCLSVGVTNTILNKEHKFSRDPNFGWVITPDGKKESALPHDDDGISGVPTFKKGSLLTFTLDLTTDGSFWVSVDNQDSCKLFGNILAALKKFNGDTSFFPFVSLQPGSVVHFLGFK